MKIHGKAAVLIALVSLLTAGTAFTQTPSDEAKTEAAASTPVAYVYVQAVEGVNVYDAASDGKLTLVKGSPFQIGGSYIEAANGKYLFTFDSAHVYSYAVESKGTIGKQVDEVDVQNYDGADCSGEPSWTGTSRGVLDHTGKSFYVQIFGYAIVEGGEQAVCSAYQSYQVSSSGRLTFNGSYIWPGSCCSGQQNLTFTGSDKFVYGLNASTATPVIQYFVRESNGTLEDFNGSEENPPSPPTSTSLGKATWEAWQPMLVDADPNGHAVVMGIFEGTTPEGAISSGRKIASYTVGSTGDLTTTNTYAELVTPAIYPTVFNFSPSGSFLAAAGGGIGQGGGLQIFHWNGSKAVTAYSGALTNSGDVEEIHWDNNNHLYAATDDNKIYVYTVTSSEIKQATGSPYSFSGGGGAGMIVVPKS